MFTKNNCIVSFLLLSVFLLSACQQKANKITVDKESMRIPVSIKDSMILSIDKSPMDMIYYPDDFPKQKMMTPGMGNPIARLIYSRPQKNGRTIFSDSGTTQNVIQQYGQEWRLGANEATEIEFFKPVSINGKTLSAGRYIIYCFPYADKWKIVFNNNLYSWGLHIDRSKDVAEAEIPVIKNDINIEYFTMLFQLSSYGCELVMAWGNIKTVLPINFN